VTAAFHDVTMVAVGQSDPPSSAQAFAGEVSHFALWNRPLPKKEIIVISSCEAEFRAKLADAVEAFRWSEDVWLPMLDTSRDNKTEPDPSAEPIGLYLDWKEVCELSVKAAEAEEEEKAKQREVMMLTFVYVRRPTNLSFVGSGK